ITRVLTCHSKDFRSLLALRAICFCGCTPIVYCKRKGLFSLRALTQPGSPFRVNTVEGLMRRELTWQAVVTAVIVAAVIAASYPYVLLKLGIGPNVSVVSAFLGAVFLLMLARSTIGQNRLMNNIVQTAGTSAAMTAFMCVIAAAVDLADQNPVVQDKLNGIHKIDPWPMFWWLTCAGGIGVLFTVIFRRHFLDDPKLVFADGVAAAETIVVLDSPGRETRDKLAALGLSSLASAVVYLFREGFGVFHEKWTYLKSL